MLEQSIGKVSAQRKSALAPGFAAAVLPVTTQTIITDDAGLTVAEVSITTADGTIPGYSARPAEGSNLPIVLVVHEVFGVHEHIRDVCRRFAKLGYLAIAPELFARQGDVAKIADIGELITTIVAKTPDAQVLSDLDATVKFAIAAGDGDPERLAVVGFCWGGRIVWLYAAHALQLKAGGAFYGRLIGQNSELQPEFPIDVVTRLKAPVRGFYGAEDHGIPLETVEAMRAMLKSSGSESEITVYHEAGHAFFADYRPSYHEESAANAWKHLLEWFKIHGV